MLSVIKDQFYGWILLTTGGNKVTSDGKNEEIENQISQGKCDGQR